MEGEIRKTKIEEKEGKNEQKQGKIWKIIWEMK